MEKGRWTTASWRRNHQTDKTGVNGIRNLLEGRAPDDDKYNYSLSFPSQSPSTQDHSIHSFPFHNPYVRTSFCFRHRSTTLAGSLSLQTLEIHPLPIPCCKYIQVIILLYIPNMPLPIPSTVDPDLILAILKLYAVTYSVKQQGY